ncbi:DUF6226 family protein [Corynebacterium halotolerans]|uniref:Uncharacterized protein n=1 Tax=Corynebacterium halotolerans YIM 70093 = DSM 44683 TaxID=1121362 RepID=M1P4A1_9CORY|nr:DUF6226 family protein [Corynebacterium halotolerans]AGF71466.1 hypothetical protein A605_02260 [Corynebacterium halotolerans YIM 70093 = DSM 44683]
MTTWWAEHNASVRERGAGTPLLDAAVALLDDVETAFAVTGAHTPGWPDPHDGGPLPEEAYGRLTDTRRYAIVAVREAAWEKVLLDRGWARLEAAGERRTLTPHRPGAVPLVFDVLDNEGTTFLRISAGRPPVELTGHPDCACDGCDFGSEDLLEAIDQDIFSAVDGSLEIRVGAGKMGVRTSFRGSGPAPDHAIRRIAAAPWAGEWSPRELIRQL